jgi:heme exporter protein B
MIWLHLKSIVTITKKDLTVEFRTRHTINFMLLFAFITLLMFSYIIGPYIYSVPAVGPGLLWLVFLFTGMLGLSRAFMREKELGTLEGIKLSPIDAESILLGKTIYNVILIILVEVIVFPLFIVLFNFPVKGSIILAFSILTLGNIGFMIVGSIMSVLVMNAKARELLLPVILFPILFPIIIVSILALEKVLVEGATFINILSEVKIIVTYIVIMSIVSILTFDYALEE